MNMTIETLARYLNSQASTLLADPLFKNLTFEKSFETGLEKLRIDYVFAQDGVDFVCDEEDKARTIFLYNDESRCFAGGLQDLPFTLTRKEVVARLGAPSKSSGGVRDPILGEYGPWDRFTRANYAIHVEYRPNVDIINKITLMRADVVPF